MKKSKYVIIVFAIAILLIAYRWAFSDNGSDSKSTDMNSTITDIMTRSSIRSYSDSLVSDAQIDTLLRAAMAAPTAGNKQPWRFVVIRDRSILDSIAANFPTMTMMKHAPLAVVVCGDTEATFQGEGVDYWIQDASAATENLLLAAHAIGLGAVWCGVCPLSERMGWFSDKLKLPDNILPLNCIAIGYPAGESRPKDKWHPEYVHYNTWDAK
ncbi:MAG: nitroreductase family protein [Muribaculaceae bacterium]|nr:nitroreductase family protein [Muribaculaceae bacterium]